MPLGARRPTGDLVPTGPARFVGSAKQAPDTSCVGAPLLRGPGALCPGAKGHSGTPWRRPPTAISCSLACSI
eukprot:2531066-Lingulodinium_polyedra.AAC.1